MASGSDVILYWAPGSVQSMSVMIALEEKGVSYTCKKVDPEKPGKVLAKELLALNPREGQVPIFKHDQLALTEPIATLMYIEEAFAGAKLVPEDLDHEALVLQRMCSAQNIGTGETSICSFLADDKKEEDKNKGQDYGDDDEDPELKKELENLAEELKIWEDYLKEIGRVLLGRPSYITGPDFTMADVAFFPVLAYVMWQGLQPKPNYLNLGKYYNMMKDRPSIAASWYDEWNKPSPEKLFRFM